MIRHFATQFKKVIVAAPAGSSYLYEFADEFIPLESQGFSGAKGRLLGEPPKPDADWHVKHPAVLWNAFGDEEFESLCSAAYSPTPKHWRNLAPSHPPSPVADVLCAFRPEKFIEERLIEGKNYAEEKCAALVGLFLDAGLTVACYGGKDNYCFENSIDLRGTPLEMQCAALSAARCAVGPSSGTMHLASLCQCPHVTWSAIRSEIVRIRYEIHWNPFCTSVRYLATPDPTPEEIFLTAMELVV